MRTTVNNSKNTNKQLKIKNNFTDRTDDQRSFLDLALWKRMLMAFYS
ncbi:hypothetical protein VCR1J2_80048 [Vibrio coralliirubri]|nr:hypothetical protein VCR1J2_80048 [Vibrio coralliirubri]CDT90568.1 hypothetical protein VCR8J2_40048 [Vibrio coralliirubri]